MLMIPGRETPLAGGIFQHDLTTFERFAEGPAQNWQQYPAAARWRVPVDVERCGMGRVDPPFEHIEPPGIVRAADADVVGHEVENQSQIGPRQGLRQPCECRLAAEFRIERIVVDDVVAVRAPGTRFQKRRGIEMADAERLEIGHEIRRGIEAEAGGKLQPIGRSRNIGRHHARLQNTVHGGSSGGAAPPQMARP